MHLTIYRIAYWTKIKLIKKICVQKKNLKISFSKRRSQKVLFVTLTSNYCHESIAQYWDSPAIYGRICRHWLRQGKLEKASLTRRLYEMCCLIMSQIKKTWKHVSIVLLSRYNFTRLFMQILRGLYLWKKTLRQCRENWFILNFFDNSYENMNHDQRNFKSILPWKFFPWRILIVMHLKRLISNNSNVLAFFCWYKICGETNFLLNLF